MTQLDLAERTGLSEAAVRSYELGTRNPKDAHREAIAEALGVSADYLREHDGRRKRGIVPLPHGDGGRGVPEARPDRRHGLRDAGPGEPRGRHPGVGREGTRLALREDRRGGVPPLEGLLRPRRRAKAHRERGRQQPFRLGQCEDGPRTDGRGAGEAAERER